MRKIVVIGIVALLVMATLALAVRAAFLLTPTPETVTEAAPTSSATPPPVERAPLTAMTAKLTIDPTAEMVWASVLTPPDFVNVFQMVDPAHGYYRTGGTTYLVAHSYAAGSGAPGNDWETLVVGDLILHGGELYEVDRVATPSHGDIAAQPVWVNDVDTLVLITCLSRGPGSPATNNYLISAHRA